MAIAVPPFLKTRDGERHEKTGWQRQNVKILWQYTRRASYFVPEPCQLVKGNNFSRNKDKLCMSDGKREKEREIKSWTT